MEVAASEVLVVHPPTSVARDFIDYPYFADLGAVQLAAVLRDRWPASVRLVDAYALPGSRLRVRDDGRLLLGAPVEEVLARCQDAAGVWGAGDAGPRAVVVTYTPFHRPPVRDDVLGAVLGGLRARVGPGVPILLVDAYQSGQHYVEAPGDAVLSAYPEVDAWVKYEAEVTVPALVEAWFSGRTRPTGVHRGTSPRSLDALPLPAWDLVDLEAYDAFRASVVRDLGRGRWAFPIDGRTLPLVTSRGCPFTCVHCSSNPGREAGEPKTQRRYSEARLRQYLRALVERFGATRLEILDELVNVNERHFDALLDELDRLGVKFDIPNGMRADYLEPRHLGLMRGRVETVSVSAESGVQRVLDEVVRKKLDLGAVDAAARNAHAAGVPLMIHWIIGLPGETGEEINATLERALSLYERYGAFPAVQYATPLPGTELSRGRSLPVVDDWGPAFQKVPSQPEMAVTPDELRRFKWTFEQRLRAARGPEKVVMNVTYVCNNHCTFCAVGTRTQVDGHPTRQREQLAKYRRAGVRMVDFDGGEPTLNPELLPLVRYARAIGYERINVTTNGRLCAYEDFARKLVRSGLTTLLFSVHGHDAQTHAQQVGVAEAFEQTVAGIRNCLAHAPDGVELGMNITLTKGNYRKLDRVTELCWDLGLRWLNVQFLTPFGRATKWVAPDTAEAARVTARVIDAWKDRIRFQVINLPFCFMPGYEPYLVGDVAKLSRHMVFVNNDEVNLAAYLAERRIYKSECGPCPHRVFCGGFYELDEAPEPPWVVRPEDLVRPIRRAFRVRPSGS
jgi:MoaA/NifB/PqqE/SkfB family radical SAM enzyme